VIQRASERALKRGTSLDQILKVAAEIREHSQSVGLIIFSYLNRFCGWGWRSSARWRAMPGWTVF